MDNSAVFEAKDRRIARMACLNTAVKICEILYANNVRGMGNGLEMVKLFAQDLEDWVYRK